MALPVSKKTGLYGLILIGLITIFFSIQLRHVRFNYDFTQFFPKGDPDLAYYEKITQEFGVNDDFLFIAIFNDNIYSARFLNQIDSLTKWLEALPDAEQVLSPTNHFRLQITPFGINRIPLYKPGNDLSKALILGPGDLEDQFFSNDSSSIGLILKHRFFAVKKEGDLFHRKVTAQLDSLGLKHLVSGKIQAQDDFVVRLEEDLGSNLIVAFLLVILALSIIFKTLRGVLIPLVTLFITIIWNVGLYGLLGKELDVLMVIVPTILLIVSMSDVIHLCNKYNELVETGFSIPKAISSSLKQVGVATLLTSVTTAAGFASLVILPVKPLRDFGLYTAIGVMLAYVVAFSLIPCLLMFSNRAVSKPGQEEVLRKRYLPALFIWTLRSRYPIMVVSGLLAILSLFGVYQLKSNTSILVGVEPDDPLAASVQFIDEQFGGYKPFELIIEVEPDAELFSTETLEVLNAVHQYLEETYQVQHLQSPLTLIKSLNRAAKGGASSAYNIPENEDLRRIERLFNSGKLTDLRSSVVSNNANLWRLTGKIRDLGSAIYLQKNSDLMTFLNQFSHSGLGFKLTGTAFLVDQTNDPNVKWIFNGLLVAISIIALLILAFTKNVRLMLISLVPNILPLIMVGGIMGILGVDLNLSTAIIFSVAFGIAVDDSIHFISRFILEKRKGRVTIYALKCTYLSTGKSIILTTTVLFAGFCVFLQSGFSATYHIGFFMSITLILALLADMMLLPVLLLKKDKFKAHRD